MLWSVSRFLVDYYKYEWPYKWHTTGPLWFRKDDYLDVHNFSETSKWAMGLSWWWLYGNWIYNYLCNQCLSPLTLWVQIPFMWGELDTTLCDKVSQWLAPGRWFSPHTPVSSTNKIDCHDITEILLKVALKFKYHNPNPKFTSWKERK